MAEPKHDESFKVVDRRLFTEQGELRQDIVEQERRDEELAAKKAASAPAPKAQAPDKASSTSGLVGHDGAPAEAPATEVEDQNEPPPSRNFQMLVDFLTRNAAAMMGGMADPRTGQPFLDLEGAREMIDMMDVLREKTQGNLAKADNDLLVEVVGSLKLSYMEVARAAADRMKKQAGGKQ